MKEKLQLLMDRLQLRPGQFAKMVDVNPAMISHILAERNKPGVDLLQKILARFPQVSPDWLLLDSGEMFREGFAPTPIPDAAHDVSSDDPSLFASDRPPVSTEAPASANAGASSASAAHATAAASVAALSTASGKQLTRVVLFYADGTFEDFVPGLSVK